ncbi:probable LRR receptor-like serine/threonine-protein kinase At2g24230 [Andrographis paniculata]|uniref:probable LRR receptor-like serine/threonine-protein kinase At2g24230 n=1 Tax=Andrographis paniculata TaxID=175694 RepID=UPI0021E837A5|nr:probable LRR receptor-like serine/threonine-protein kinase At2g24230 [Andrographis paniculata]
MDLGVFALILFLTLILNPSAAQELNSDGFFVSKFLQNFGIQIPNATHCSWRGVFCDLTGANIVRLEFSNLGLSGPIPDNTIGKMVKLQHLDLSSNQITALPSDFWSLNSLTHLDLSLNRLSGELSNNIANFAQLRTLDLSSNNFSGSIPESIGVLTSLTALNLSYNVFDSWIPQAIVHCSSLASMDLSANKLNGSLPERFGVAFPALKLLNMADNEISSRDSPDLFRMNSIQYFNVSGNLFGGPIGVFAGAVEVVDLSRNQFEGNVGQLAYNLSNLVYLDISENMVNGEFGVDFSQISNLRHLNIAGNIFSKQQFVRVDTLSSLEYLNVSGSSLVGSIPGKIAGLSSLTVLDVSSNELTGPIPSALLERLPGMRSFNFSGNRLSVCPSGFPVDILETSFRGLVSICPIAADPQRLKRTGSNRTGGLKLGLALSISLIVVLVLLLFLAFGRRRRKNRMWAVRHAFYEEECSFDSGSWATTDAKQTAPVPVNDKQELSISAPVIIFEKPLTNFTYADLMSATRNFDRSMLLAEGWFGPVYSALFPGQGFRVAIKVLVRESPMTDREAIKELDYLGRIKHPNLVTLTGYCLAGDKKLVIYEYMDNGNLRNLLYSSVNGGQSTGNENDPVSVKGLLPSWRFRFNILLGSARALAFLHHGCSPPIVHRDVKASSVYLDNNLEPRLSHFGLGKIFGDVVENENVDRGTTGYSAPELLGPESGAPSTKSDVYAYGVILFELLTGKKPVGDYYSETDDSELVSWVRRLVRTNDGICSIDPKIRGNAPERKMAEALKIGYLCTAEVPSKRPSMQQVVGLLKDLEPVTEE